MADSKPVHLNQDTGRMSSQAGTHETWLDRLLHPGHIPPEALSGGTTPEQAWERWCENRAARAAHQGVPHQRLFSAERWWFGRFGAAWQQQHGAELGRSLSKADVEAEAGS